MNMGFENPSTLEEQQAVVDIPDEALSVEKARANAEANLESAKELFQLP